MCNGHAFSLVCCIALIFVAGGRLAIVLQLWYGQPHCNCEQSNLESRIGSKCGKSQSLDGINL